MTLITAEQFRKAQAHAYNKRGIVRVMELRQEARKLFPPVTLQMHWSYGQTVADLQQIDALITFLLDINGEDGTMESIGIPVHKPDPPEGAS